MHQAPTAPQRILVVDDLAENRQLVRRVLEPAGYEVLTASDGAEALEVVARDRPNLVLLDVRMPGMDGFEVCARLKTDEATQGIPVIFLSAMDDPDAQTRGFDLGAADYISKPINVAVLRARVHTHLALYAQRRSLEGMFRDVIEFAPDAFILTDTGGLIVQVNARAEALFCYARRELLGQDAGLLLPDWSDLMSSGMGGDEAARGVLTGEVRCRRHDGSEFAGEISLSPLQTNRGGLLMAVVRDVTENRRIQQEIATSRQRIRELAAQSEAVREYERKSIAREVHDELGQVLTALRMDLTFLNMVYSSQVPELEEKVQSMRDLVDRAITGVRNVAANLRPTALDMGLVSAIDWVCAEFTRNTNIPCQVDAQASDEGLAEDRAIGLFRIVQESLTNITRYAQARQVQVILRQDPEHLSLEVHDDGKGFEPGQSGRKNSFGLLGMQERALALGGTLDIDSAPGQGTRIRATVPVHHASLWQEVHS